MVRPLYRYSLVSARPSAWSPQRTNTKGVLHSHSRNKPPAACSAQGQERQRKEWRLAHANVSLHPADRPCLFAAAGLGNPAGEAARLG